MKFHVYPFVFLIISYRTVHRELVLSILLGTIVCGSVIDWYTVSMRRSSFSCKGFSDGVYKIVVQLVLS